MATLPSFLVIGSAKCGTTTLCALLDQHPDVFVHPDKELNFFCFDALYARGIDWYAARFEAAGAARAVGEGSPNYAKHVLHPEAPARIARHLPDARLIYMVRHPLRRMESAWLHARRSGHRSRASFTATVRRQPSYLDTSDYGRQLGFYREHFAEDRILVLFLEDLRSDPQGTLKRCFDFLGVDAAIPVTGSDRARNVSAGKRVDTVLGHALRRAPGYAALERRGGRRFRRFRKRWLQRELAGPPQWDPDTLRLVRERLAAPTARFLTAHGKPPDFWSFE